jgi:hypothetical protein
MRSFFGFLRKTDGLTTIEWVALTAVVLFAALGITGYLLQALDGYGGAMSRKMCTEAKAIDPTTNCN